MDPRTNLDNVRLANDLLLSGKRDHHLRSTSRRRLSLFERWRTGPPFLVCGYPRIPPTGSYVGLEPSKRASHRLCREPVAPSTENPWNPDKGSAGPIFT